MQADFIVHGALSKSLLAIASYLSSQLRGHQVTFTALYMQLVVPMAKRSRRNSVVFNRHEMEGEMRKSSCIRAGEVRAGRPSRLRRLR